MDDTKIITMAVKLYDLVSSRTSHQLKFLITTHHPLFFNVITNSFKKAKGCSLKSYNLSRHYQDFVFSEEKDDSPFGYHLLLKELIDNAIKDGAIEKYHFNLFRNLLEKTANFLGYTHWTDCIPEKNKKEVSRMLNLYSHSKLSDVESKHLSIADKVLFQETFNAFIEDFKWKEEKSHS